MAINSPLPFMFSVWAKRAYGEYAAAQGLGVNLFNTSDFDSYDIKYVAKFSDGSVLRLTLEMPHGE